MKVSYFYHKYFISLLLHHIVVLIIPDELFPHNINISLPPSYRAGIFHY